MPICHDCGIELTDTYHIGVFLHPAGLGPCKTQDPPEAFGLDMAGEADQELSPELEES